MVTEGTEKPTIIFTYGTLKRGFSNHVLLQDMIAAGDASFLGVYQTVDRLPLVCGPYRVPFLLNFPGSGEHVRGELYAVSGRGLIRMDELEGITRAHYERLPIKIRPEIDEESESGRQWRWKRIMHTETMRRRCGRETERRVSDVIQRKRRKGM
ncbi:hypothetical protein H5410_017317 [Solanum commersonii]|uniref:Gamma-glutamylcyclotransferase family protein n=1 Tax=Solanum commersonii TaxID=4109 RepID=A0A9J5ZYT7_SOLCO|nr:hypothetical protein H5410_017317 [Solanum commersonii]